MQTFQVVPNERTLESEFIKRNIEATRFAYGLDNVESVNYNAKTTATEGALRADAQTTAQIRIIDPALVSSSFRQLEQYRQYYNFSNHLDVDRYNLNGKSQDTVIAVRELNQSGLGSSQSWINNVIVYTHGYGVVAAYGNQRSVDGQPVFLQSGIPSTGALGKYNAKIYFGEASPSYSIVGGPKGSKPLEMDYPAGKGASQQTYTTFTGNVAANSDERLKQNWRDLPSDFLARLAEVKMGIYDRKDTGDTQAGVSAQSMKALLFPVVREGTDGMLSVAYGNAALVAAIELAREVVSLRRELNELKGA